jgi:hypothetical protein
MKMHAPQPAKTKSIPSISKKICNGDLYCSNAHPMASMNANMTTIKVMIIGMSL